MRASLTTQPAWMLEREVAWNAEWMARAGTVRGVWPEGVPVSASFGDQQLNYLLLCAEVARELLAERGDGPPGR